MPLLNSYDYIIPQQILAALVFLGIPLMFLAELYLRNIRKRKTKHPKLIFGIGSIIHGSAILIIAICGTIVYPKNTEYTLAGPEFPHLLPVFVILCIILVTRGMLLIAKRQEN